MEALFPSYQTRSYSVVHTLMDWLYCTAIDRRHIYQFSGPPSYIIQHSLLSNTRHSSICYLVDHEVTRISPSRPPLCSSRHAHPSSDWTNVISASLSIDLLRIEHLWGPLQGFTSAIDPQRSIGVTCLGFARILTLNHG